MICSSHNGILYWRQTQTNLRATLNPSALKMSPFELGPLFLLKRPPGFLKKTHHIWEFVRYSWVSANIVDFLQQCWCHLSPMNWWKMLFLPLCLQYGNVFVCVCKRWQNVYILPFIRFLWVTTSPGRYCMFLYVCATRASNTDTQFLHRWCQQSHLYFGAHLFIVQYYPTFVTLLQNYILWSVWKRKIEKSLSIILPQIEWMKCYVLPIIEGLLISYSIKSF